MSAPRGDDRPGAADAARRNPSCGDGGRAGIAGATFGTGLASEPMLVDQISAPAVGLILQRHKVFVDQGEALLVDGERAVALCGAWVTVGASPAEVEPGVPATHVEDCPDCRAIHLGEADLPMPGDPIRWFVRRVGTPVVHVVTDDGITATRLVAQCGRSFRLGEPLERLAAGDGVPCTACLLAAPSDGGLLGRVPGDPPRLGCPPGAGR
ncbi:hypothetical protein FHR81_002734 [Actinoalloteichus hoggarensis]|uniref:Uncharacterized protein n=1 Tax=Actinoalloteichus hoggarensis TaxID=1470176 RepID=A0A221VYK8_9PSEU|nr:hypothetical protein [Actinoalloteichus hoggarensis]ASO18331.1 hypothetical protein AHOG_03365 [Actinoalloteichus hoggarensis]MBB5921694.1 hypothetical protein [Actinoalloteichus hoggarensis]